MVIGKSGGYGFLLEVHIGQIPVIHKELTLTFIDIHLLVKYPACQPITSTNT